MNRNEFHQQARILAGDHYDGHLLDKLFDTVKRAEREAPAHAHLSPSNFYRPTKFGLGSTVETPATSRYEADNCEHCHAAYGHTVVCPLLNRAVAEARSAF